jgi:hypothetical protein
MTYPFGCPRAVAAIAGVVSSLTFAAAGADPLATPALAGPLRANDEPLSFNGQVFGKVYASGQLSALGVLQDRGANAIDAVNAQVELQTIEGPLQFYLQAGAYSLPAVGTPYLRARDMVRGLYGVLPVGYLKFTPLPEVAILAGSLPALIGAESTFTFQNMNIERGLLWNQEPAISRGVQLNYSHGPATVMVSWNDGYYSGKYNWLSALLSLTIGENDTLALAAGGNTSANRKVSGATPLAQNNSKILNLIYSHTAGALTLNPYLQYTRVVRDA